MSKNCETCRFFSADADPKEDEHSGGDCRAHPPVLWPNMKAHPWNGDLWWWPAVSEDDWCGEWQGTVT